MDITDEIKNTISAEVFRSRPAEEIFSDVKSFGSMLVTKNDVPECIMLSPAEYTRLRDELELLRQEKLIAEDMLSMTSLNDDTQLMENELEELL